MTYVSEVTQSWAPGRGPAGREVARVGAAAFRVMESWGVVSSSLGCMSSADSVSGPPVIDKSNEKGDKDEGGRCWGLGVSGQV